MADGIVNFLHLLATAVWIGGMIFMHFVFLPSLSAVEPQHAARVQGGVAKRFTMAAWTSVIVLLVTGYLKTPDGMLLNTTSDLGLILTVKHLLILGMIAVGLIITLVVVPKLKVSAPKPGEGPTADFIGYQKRLSMLSTTNTVLGLAVLVCASFLW